MRIAVIAPPWLPVPPEGYGGTELVLDNLCRGLKARGHDLLLFATGDSTCTVERAWEYDSHVGIERGRPATELRQAMAGYDTAAKWDADIVHDHTVIGPVWAQLHANVPVITTNHGPFTGDFGDVYRRLAQRVPVIAISHHQASLAAGAPIYAVIHHGIDTAAITPGDGRGGFALFLGRMTPDKGVCIAIDAARDAGLPLRIAAKMRDPDELEYFRAEVEPRLGGEVEYLGEVGRDEKYALLREAMCLLNPIVWPEPFGMVMIEALATGTPVVGSPHGAAPEIVDDGATGFLCADVSQLAGRLQQVGELDRRECRRQAVERFSLERMARDHEAVYASLLAAARGEDAELETIVTGHDEGEFART